jgi:hypothetical protein
MKRQAELLADLEGPIPTTVLDTQLNVASSTVSSGGEVNPSALSSELIALNLQIEATALGVESMAAGEERTASSLRAPLLSQAVVNAPRLAFPAIKDRLAAPFSTPIAPDAADAEPGALTEPADRRLIALIEGEGAGDLDRRRASQTREVLPGLLSIELSGSSAIGKILGDEHLSASGDRSRW